MRIITILLFIVIASPAYSEKAPVFFDSGIDTYILSAQNSTEMFLRNKKKQGRISLGEGYTSEKIHEKGIIKNCG